MYVYLRQPENEKGCCKCEMTFATFLIRYTLVDT